MSIVMDVIVSWPRNNDYPLWRDFIRKNRTKFNNIIIVFTETNQGEDYRQFVKDAMFEDFVLCTNSPLPKHGQDWRNVAVNFGLNQSLHAPWIWFTEQDFFGRDSFFRSMQTMVDMGMDAVVTYDATRMHPCNILVKRDVINRTKKDFGIDPGKLDHFGKIQRDLEGMGIQIGSEDDDSYFHFNGLSHNWTLISNGEKPNYKPEQFMEYILMCLDLKIKMDERWLKVANAFISTNSTTPLPRK